MLFAFFEKIFAQSRLISYICKIKESRTLRISKTICVRLKSDFLQPFNNHQINMKTLKQIFIVLLALLPALNAFAFQVTSEKAIETVTAFRGMAADSGLYYIAQSDTLINNRYCHFDTLPSSALWAATNAAKWVVFVDEQPQNRMWSHPCRYYYVPTQVESLDQIPVAEFAGSFYPYFLNPQLAYGSQIEQQPSPEITSFSPIINQTNPQSLSRGPLYVVMIAGGSNPGDNNEIFYQNTKYLYKVLTQKYSIPKDNIFLLFGSGGRFANDANNGNFTMPTDFDDDGISDVIASTNVYYVDSIFNHVAQLNDIENSHLMVFFNAHGNESGTIQLWEVGIDNHDFNHNEITPDSLRFHLDEIPSLSQSLIMMTCHSGHYLSLADDARVVITGCRADEVLVDFEGVKDGATFPRRFINALNESTEGGTNFEFPRIPDSDGNGWVSMLEAYLHGIDYNPIYPSSFNSEEYGHPQYSSRCSRLGQTWAINHLPDPYGFLLKNNSNPNDNGLSTIDHYSIGYFPWESPDIWIRRANDGLTNQETEAIPITGMNDKAYIYTRVRSQGYKPYQGQGRYLHLHWAQPALRHYKESWMSTSLPDTWQHEIAILPLATPIDTLSDTIICYQWNIPQAVANQVINQYGGIFRPALLARVSDSASKANLDHDGLIYPFIYSSSRSVFTQEAMAVQSYVTNDSTNHSVSVRLPLFVNENDTQPLEILIRKKNYGDNYTNGISISIQLDSMLAATRYDNISQFNLAYYDTQIISFNNLVPDRIYWLTATANINPNTVLQNHNIAEIPLVLRAGFVEVGGVTFRLNLLARNNQLDPGISDSGGDDGGEDPDYPDYPEPADSDGAITPRMLYLSGVNEPVECEWLDNNGNILGRGDSLAIPMNAKGEYTLSVRALSDGATASVSKAIRPITCIKDIRVENSHLVATLRRSATSDLTISIRSTLCNNSEISTPVTEGSKTVNVPVSGLNPGLYLVSLHDGNQVLETKQIFINQ